MENVTGNVVFGASVPIEKPVAGSAPGQGTLPTKTLLGTNDVFAGIVSEMVTSVG
ncbi:hypothetical protein D3C84_1243410 [compost metagenome]